MDYYIISIHESHYLRQAMHLGRDVDLPRIFNTLITPSRAIFIYTKLT